MEAGFVLWRVGIEERGEVTTPEFLQQMRDQCIGMDVTVEFGRQPMKGKVLSAYIDDGELRAVVDLPYSLRPALVSRPGKGYNELFEVSLVAQPSPLPTQERENNESQTAL